MLLPISRGSQLSRAKKELSLERRKGAAGRMKMDPQVWHKVAAISGTSSNESLLLLSLFPFSSVTINSKWKIHWNRYGCTWIGNLWRPRLQAPKPFLQRCMFPCFPFPPMAFHFYFITYFFLIYLFAIFFSIGNLQSICKGLAYSIALPFGSYCCLSCRSDYKKSQCCKFPFLNFPTWFFLFLHFLCLQCDNIIKYD